MAYIGIFLWMLFFAILAFSMMPGPITAVAIISFIGGLLDASRKNKKKKEKEEKERQRAMERQREKWRRIANNPLEDDSDLII